MDLACVLGDARAALAAGDFAAAAAQCEEICAQAPGDADALQLLGIARSQLGDHRSALEAIDAAIAFEADRASLHVDRGVVLRRLGRAAESLDACRKATQLAPDFPQAWAGRGAAALEGAHAEEALECYDRARALAPHWAEALANRALALRALRRPAEALESCDAALALRPDFVTAQCNRAAILQELGRLDEALECSARALDTDPAHVQSLVNLGLTLIALDRPADAIDSFDRALAASPGHIEALYNRGWALLSLGDFEQGWEGYAARWARPQAEPRALAAFPEWRGEPLAGRSILVYEEQGAGDVLQFVRYLPLLAAQGGRVAFFVRASLHALLATLPGDVALLDTIGEGQTFDFQCALLDLPRLCGTRRDTIPDTTPYLTAEPDRVARWAQRVGADGFRIGICWQGNPASDNDTSRFMPLAAFAPLAALPGMRLISLQKHHGLEQLHSLPDGMSVETLDGFDDGPDAFLDAAAVMTCLDLIICADSALAHLSGALGLPAFVGLKCAADWRWMTEREDSPWHPTLRLFRQQKPGSWRDVFDRMARAVTEMRGAAAGFPKIPVSVGDLLDKITILEIKAARIAAPVARRNVLRDLATLRGIESACDIPSNDRMELTDALRAVNEIIWDVENTLRQCESRGDFGADFIAAARSVYVANDRRAAIKRRIDELTRSPIVEEKWHRS